MLFLLLLTTRTSSTVGDAEFSRWHVAIVGASAAAAPALFLGAVWWLDGNPLAGPWSWDDVALGALLGAMFAAVGAILGLLVASHVHLRKGVQ